MPGRLHGSLQTSPRGENQSEPAVVFISNAHEDRRFVLRLAEALQLQGIQVFGDWLLTRGDNYEPQLESLQLAADVFVFVISPESLSSIPCKAEVSRAVALHQRILPVVHRDQGLDEEQIPLELKTPQWTLLREGDDFVAEMRGLIEAIQYRLLLDA